MAQRKGFKKLTRVQKRNLLIAGVGVAAFLLWRRRAQASEFVELETAGVRGGEFVSATSYREIGARRPGMTYVPTESGDIGSEISFTPNKSGEFTRNFVREGNQLWAEIR